MIDSDRAGRAARLGAAPLCDALGRRHAHRAHVHDLVSPTPDRPLFGPALTMRFLPLRRDLVDPSVHDFGALVAAAGAGADLTGRVLVAAADDTEQAVAGGKKLSRLRNHGLLGLVTDGRVRDLAEGAEMGLAIWCRGEAVKNANDVLMAFETDVPVSLAGVTVVAGDWVYADRSGAVVIPAADVDDVLADAEAIAERDAAEVARRQAEDAARGPG